MKEYKLQPIKRRHSKQVIAVVKALKGADIDLGSLTKGFLSQENLELSQEEIANYESAMSSTDRAKYEELSEEVRKDLLKQMKSDEMQTHKIIMTIVDLVSMFESVQDSIDELLIALSDDMTRDELLELDLFEEYVPLVMSLAKVKGIKRAFSMAWR